MLLGGKIIHGEKHDKLVHFGCHGGECIGCIAGVVEGVDPSYERVGAGIWEVGVLEGMVVEPERIIRPFWKHACGTKTCSIISKS